MPGFTNMIPTDMALSATGDGFGALQGVVDLAILADCWIGVTIGGNV